jgi:hypothetical protein
VAIAHNAKAFDQHFILNRAIMLKWNPELITNGLKIISMKMEHLLFLVGVSFFPCALRKLSEACDLQVTKSGYPHYFNNKENLDYFGPMPDIYYLVDELSGRERKEFLPWYETHKSDLFDNRIVLESYCQDDSLFYDKPVVIFDAVS